MIFLWNDVETVLTNKHLLKGMNEILNGVARDFFQNFSVKSLNMQKSFASLYEDLFQIDFFNC